MSKLYGCLTTRYKVTGLIYPVFLDSVGDEILAKPGSSHRLEQSFADLRLARVSWSVNSKIKVCGLRNYDIFLKDLRVLLFLHHQRCVALQGIAEVRSSKICVRIK